MILAISQRLYNQVMMADDFTCVYCGLRTPDVQVDHIIPRAHGGPDTLHNLVAACWPCNMRKSDYQLHQVKMRLAHGRFGRSVSHPMKTRIKPLIDIPIPPINRPQLSSTERVQQIEGLARERKEDGAYRYSANQISRIVGGTNGKNLALVAAIRSEIVQQES